MKTKLIPILICACTLLMLTNCTIEKRLFQKGYHIEWKKKTPQDQASAESGKLQPATDKDLTVQTPEKTALRDQHAESLVSAGEKNTPEISASTITQKSADKAPDSGQKTSLQESVSTDKETKSTPPDQTDEDDPEVQNIPKTFEPVGIASFSLYFLAFGLGLCAFIAANPIAVLGYTALLLLMTLVLGIISVVRYHRNKERYRPNFFGYFGLIASSATLIFVLILLMFYAILLLYSWPG